ncbi:hemerythrin domain-containing protein [Bailinhaonella thermotolerans]|uniref:Hemerythrin domain-containing protein n=1 Tax=Bailinhaonella thermotolerans TaxID=1070861 RepID=A0A3A4B2L2_9ACTN|nr:hemerythrin domain-containing protein [Bailinhaonella thermotolerans]RJL32415.1 hemerythrin domain-containing protein [Bailinhaonella thermotolerans]
MRDHGESVIEILTTDHREVEGVFHRLENGRLDDPAERKNLAQQAIIELVRHSVAEEMYLYPATRKFVPNGDVIADREIADHAAAERVMKELETLEPDAPRFEPALRELMTEVRRHIQDEESNLFPLLVQHCDPEELLDLGRSVERAKKLAPTRPHPSAPDRPPLNKLLAPGAGLVDRVRDAFSKRGE